MLGYCDYHQTFIGHERFEFKGCWTCGYFELFGDYFYTKEAADELKISVKTLYRWIRKGKVQADSFVMIERKLAVPRRIYLISKEEVERIKAMIRPSPKSN